MGQRDPEERRAWGPAHSRRAVHTDRLARTIVQRIDMAGQRGRLHGHPFALILGRLQEALDAGGAVYPVTQGHRQCLVRGEASEQVMVSHVRVAPQQRASLIRMMAAVVGTCVERWHVIGSPGKRRLSIRPSISLLSQSPAALSRHVMHRPCGPPEVPAATAGCPPCAELSRAALG